MKFYLQDINDMLYDVKVEMRKRLEVQSKDSIWECLSLHEIEQLEETLQHIKELKEIIK